MAEKKFEESIKRLEEVVEKMESGDLSLEESMKYYEEGILLSRTCYKKLAEAEKKIEKLVKKSGGEGREEFTTEEFEPNANEEK